MDQKVRGLLSYLFGWLGGLIILFAFKDNTKETNKNACQAITGSALHIIIAIVISTLSTIFTVIFAAMDVTALKVISSLLFGALTFGVNIAYLIFAIMGMVKAYQEKDFTVPVITPLTEKIFKSKLA